MKILFLTDNFIPEVNAPANRTYEHCLEWVKKGADVTVITCAPNFPQGKVYEGYKNKIYQKETIQGIKVIRVWSYITSNKGFAKRILDYLSFAFMGFWASLFVKTDLIVATSPQFFTAVSGYLSSVFKRRPWVMEVRDLWPESIKAVNAIKEDSFVITWLEKLELFLYRKAKRVVVVTDAFKKNLIDRNIPAAKINVIKNGVNANKFFPVDKNEELIASLGLQGKFIIGYLGTHGMAHKLDFILNSVDGVDPNVHFLFIGDGAEKEKLVQLKEKLQLQNVTMLSSVPKSEVMNYLSIVDLSLVPLKKSDTFKTVIPSKIFECAAMKIPILLGVEGESKEIIESYGAGICFEPENKNDLLEKIKEIQSNQQFYKKCQIGCEKLAADFERKTLANRMYTILEKLPKV